MVALAELGRVEEARQVLERIKTIKPDFDLNFVVSTFQRVRLAGPEPYIDALRKVGLEN